MADRRSNPKPYDTYTSSPLWNDVAGGLNQLGNPLKSIGGRVLNEWNKFGNYLGLNAYDVSTDGVDANTPYRTNYPEGDFQHGLFAKQTGKNFQNKVNNFVNPSTQAQSFPATPNMGDSVGTLAEQKAYREGYITPIPPISQKPAGPPGGLLNNQQFKEKYGPGQSGLNIGTRIATQKNQEGLFNGTLDKIFNNPALQRMMEASLYTKGRFQGQEGGLEGFQSDVAGAAQGEVSLRAVEADEAERISKEAIARAKNTKDPRDLMAKEPIIKMYRRVQGSRIALEKTTRMQTLLNDSAWTTGGPGKVSDFLTGFAAIVGIPLRSSKKEEMMVELDVIIDQLVKSGAFGRDASATDYKTMFRSIGTPTWTTNRDILSKKFSSFQDQTSRNIKIDESYLNTLGVSIPGIEANASKRPGFSRKRNPS